MIRVACYQAQIGVIGRWQTFPRIISGLAAVNGKLVRLYRIGQFVINGQADDDSGPKVRHLSRDTVFGGSNSNLMRKFRDGLTLRVKCFNHHYPSTGREQVCALVVLYVCSGIACVRQRHFFDVKAEVSSLIRLRGEVDPPPIIQFNRR